jgi:hypothetical protein
MRPAWLPNILSLDGTWEKTLAMLYTIFAKDFIRADLHFEHRPVWWDKRKSDSQYEDGFWHVISTKNYETGDRIPDYERAKRLPWCAPTITNSDDGEVKCWDYLESDGGIRTYLWLEQWDYVVILEKRIQRIGEIAFLITAFYVRGNRTREQLKQKYKQQVRCTLNAFVARLGDERSLSTDGR